jgi:hypothetical protein
MRAAYSDASFAEFCAKSGLAKGLREAHHSRIRDNLTLNDRNHT